MTADPHPHDHVSGTPFFRPGDAAGYRLLTDAPVFLRSDSDLGRLVGDPALAGEWADKQAQLMRWTRDNVMFMRALGIVIDVMKEVAPEESPSEIATPVMLPVLMEFIEKYPEFGDLLGGPPPG